jgi:excinuclease ABC subunit C
MTKEEFSVISSSIPLEPGIYKYFNDADEMIYVGKAKQLKKRISSYFLSNIPNQKTVELVKHIKRIEYTIVDNEDDAFFLENNLIKEYLPHYNIRLKDDKSYPYVVIKNERFPRVFFTRKKRKDNAQYYGPFTSIANAKEIIDFIKQYFPLRNCKLNLSDKNIKAEKFKVCLEYHLGNCKGPCQQFQNEEEYNEGISQLIHMLKGNLQPLMNQLKYNLQQQIDDLAFEQAAITQAKIVRLQQYKSTSTVVNTRTGNIDVFSILEEGNLAFINYLAVNDGSVYRTKTITIEKALDENASSILAFGIQQLREMFNSEANEIIVPIEISFPSTTLKITVPKAGDKKKLLELSQKNVNYFRKEMEQHKMLHLEEVSRDLATDILVKVQKDLKLQSKPTHIECFDNSHIQGTNTVSAMVCFKNGVPSKSDYRHYNIKTVVGIDDFASMKEAVYRRYKRLIDENTTLPQLVIIDGGKGQLSAALESIEQLGLLGKLTLVGLAKNQEELFFANDSESLQLPWDSDSLKLIRRIRDEVHRFGITHHRNRRSKSALDNELIHISGIGKSTAEMLLQHFRTIKNIKAATEKEIANVVGLKRAKILTDYFKL